MFPSMLNTFNWSLHIESRIGVIRHGGLHSVAPGAINSQSLFKTCICTYLCVPLLLCVFFSREWFNKSK